jgi:hypothetical protein
LAECFVLSKYKVHSVLAYVLMLISQSVYQA